MVPSTVRVASAVARIIHAGAVARGFPQQVECQPVDDLRVLRTQIPHVVSRRSADRADVASRSVRPCA